MHVNCVALSWSFGIFDVGRNSSGEVLGLCLEVLSICHPSVRC